MLSPQVPQFVFGLRQQSLPLWAQLAAGSVDVEAQHRHRTAVGGAFFAWTLLRRLPQRAGDGCRVVEAEDAGLELKRMAVACDALAPALLAHARCLSLALVCSSRLSTAASLSCSKLS